MSSSKVQELNEKIDKLREKYSVCRNENTKLDLLKKLEVAKNELNIAIEEEKAKSKSGFKDQALVSEKQKEGFKDESIDKRPNHKDINRGKVSEPNANSTEKKEDKKD